MIVRMFENNTNYSMKTRRSIFWTSRKSNFCTRGTRGGRTFVLVVVLIFFNVREKRKRNGGGKRNRLVPRTRCLLAPPMHFYLVHVLSKAPHATPQTGIVDIHKRDDRIGAQYQCRGESGNIGAEGFSPPQESKVEAPFSK